MKNREKKALTFEEVLFKMEQYCAYQERCPQEVLTKLITLGVFGEDKDKILEWLEAEGFLDENRFALAFVQGKFNQKKWGKVRLRAELRARQIKETYIQAALAGIEEENYRATLKNVIEYKAKDLTAETDDYQRRTKIANYALQKGYESHLIWELLGQD